MLIFVGECAPGANVTLKWRPTNTTAISVYPLATPLLLYISSGLRRYLVAPAVTFASGAIGFNYTIPAWLPAGTGQRYFFYLELNGPAAASRPRWLDTSAAASAAVPLGGVYKQLNHNVVSEYHHLL